MTIELATGTQEVDGAEVHITFDPTRLQVVDSTGAPASTITAGTTLDVPIQNSANNTSGQIDYAAGTFRSPGPSGTFTVATITFRAVLPTTASGTAVSYTDSAGRTNLVTFNGAALPLATLGAQVFITP
jgi:hypothetical protein